MTKKKIAQRRDTTQRSTRPCWAPAGSGRNATGDLSVDSMFARSSALLCSVLGRAAVLGNCAIHRDLGVKKYREH